MRGHMEKIVDVIVQGLEVFGDKDRFISWLKRPCIALGGKAPLSLLDSRVGAEKVLDVLGRIEGGVYS